MSPDSCHKGGYEPLSAVGHFLDGGEPVPSALQGTDIDAIQRATKELNDVMQKIGTAVYQQQQPPPEPPPGAEPPPPPPGQEGGEGEGTVEGEFREV